MKNLSLFICCLFMLFSFSFKVSAKSNSEFNVDYSYTLEEYSTLYEYITTYNHPSDSYIFFFSGGRKHICYDPVFNEFGSVRSNLYSIDCSSIYVFNNTQGITTTSIWRYIANGDQYYDNTVDMLIDISLLYAHNVTTSSLGLSEYIPITFVNSGSSVNSDFTNLNTDIYLAADSNTNIRGLLNMLYESPVITYSYSVNYYYNDELDSSKSETGTGVAGSTLELIDKSYGDYTIDNNEYEVTLSEDNMTFNLYYYDEYFGTDYELIDTSNTHIPFNFSVRYLNTIFPNINFNRFNQFQQFVICLLINIFFILILYFIIHFIRIAFAYLMRLF